MTYAIITMLAGIAILIIYDLVRFREGWKVLILIGLVLMPLLSSVINYLIRDYVDEQIAQGNMGDSRYLHVHVSSFFELLTYIFLFFGLFYSKKNRIKDLTDDLPPEN